MANRYWVGGTGNWDTSSTSNWSTTSGGAGGASAPTSADDVFLDSNSGFPSFTSANLNGAAYSPALNLYVVVGASGTILTSTDSVTWTSRTSGFANELYAVAYGNGVFVAVGDSYSSSDYSVIQSTDGINWSTVTHSPTQKQYRDIIWSNSRFGFVAVGYGGVISYMYITPSGIGDFTTDESQSSPATNFLSIAENSSGPSLMAIGEFGQSYKYSSGTWSNETSSPGFDYSWSVCAVPSYMNSGIETFFTFLAMGGSGTVSRFDEITGDWVFFENQFSNFSSVDSIMQTAVTYPILALYSNQSTTVNSLRYDATFTSSYVSFSASGITTRRIKALPLTSSSPYTFKWIILGQSGFIATSDDTSTWTIRSNASATTITRTSAVACKSIDATGFVGGVTQSSGDNTLTIGGSLTLGISVTEFFSTTLIFDGTGTITTNGFTINSTNFRINGSGITVSLGSALTIPTNGTITVEQGTFTTAGYAILAGTINYSVTNLGALNLGSSTITLQGGTPLNLAGPTTNAGTSQINLTGASSLNANLILGTSTLYNLSFLNDFGTIGTRTITGAATFNNLTLVSATLGLGVYSIVNDLTVNGTLICSSTSPVNRVFIRSSVLGTARTITAAAVSASDCDFRDITIAGAAAGVSPTRAGDCGGNSGITFPAAKTVYRVGTLTTWSGTQAGGFSSWALTSGGVPNENNFPLAQDTAVINNSTTLTGTLSLEVYNIGALDCSARTTGITLSHTVQPTRYGSYTLGSGVTVTGTITQVFSGRGTMVFTSAGKTITFGFFVDTPSGTLQLGDAFNSTQGSFVNSGTFNANNYNFTCTTFSSSNSNTRTITMGSGLWTLSGTGTVWSTPTTTGLTFNKNTANILLSNTTTSSRLVSNGGLSFNKLTIGGSTGTSITAFLLGSFTELATTKTVAHTVRFSGNGATIDTWSITGTTGNVVTVDSSTSGTQRTINITNVTSGINFLSVKDIGVNQTNRFYVGTNSTNGGNNSNVIFTDPPAPGGPAGITIPSGLTITGGITFSA
jgi:hypothetical protein